MSGGVDSSVAALLLMQQGYRVVGVYMKNWTKDLPGVPCPWQDDFTDAKRVAVRLGIDFKVFDFQKQYHQKVVDQMIQQYKRFQVGDLDPTTGIETFVDRQFKLAVSAADKLATLNISINHNQLRIESIDGTAATTDTITMIARLGRV